MYLREKPLLEKIQRMHQEYAKLRHEFNEVVRENHQLKQQLRQRDSSQKQK